MGAKEDDTARSYPGGAGGDTEQSGGGGAGGGEAAVRPGGKPPRGLEKEEDPRGPEEDEGPRDPEEDVDPRGMEEDEGPRGPEEDEPQQALDGATAADADAITPWRYRYFNTEALKPELPGPTRIMTAPRMAAPGQEMWTRAAATRDQVNYAVELKNLSSSVATIGSGAGKICTGFGLKITSQEEKEAAAAMEKKALEEKKVAQELLAAEEKLAVAKLNATEIEERKKKKEEEERRKEEQAKKEQRISLLLSVPGHLVNISCVLNGLGEIASGTKGVAVSMSMMIRGVPSLVSRVRATAKDWVGGSSKCCNMGTGSVGFRMALDRQVVTRAYDGRVSVVDAFGSRREQVPAALGGALIITNEEELHGAIADFRNGRLSQLIDVDEKAVTLMMAWNMWRLLRRERLCGLLRPDSLLPEMALRASALVDEETAVKGHFKDAENAVKNAEKAVKEHQSTIDELQARLHKSRNGAVVPKVEMP